MATTTVPSIDRFIGLVNRTNKLALLKDNLDIGLPTVISTTASLNTSVVLTSKSAAPHRGKTNVHYHRMNLAEVYMSPKDTISISLSDALKLTVSGLVGLLNAAGGTKMDPSEVVSGSLNITKLPATFTLKAKPESYAYTGQVVITLKAKLL